MVMGGCWVDGRMVVCCAACCRTQVTPVLQSIFGTSGYLCAGAGGDFVLPNTREYQPLHVDLDFPGCHDQPASPVVTLNVPLQPLTWDNGPTKLCPL